MQKGQILVAFFLTLLAVSFTGGKTQGVGFSKECTDGINNDPGIDSVIDGEDPACLSYPYADGLGETNTPIGPDYQADYYEYSLWDYQWEYGVNAGDVAYWCSNEATQQAQFDATTSYSNGKDRAGPDFAYWAGQNCP